MCILDAVLTIATKHIRGLILFALLLACVLLCTTHASGQGFDIYRSHLHQLKVEQINADDGLSQGMVNSLVFDKAGYMWIGTKDGLNRYDGNSFKVYHHNPDDSNTMQKNYVEHVNIDSKDRIWVTYSGGGLDLFDRSTETFIHIASKITTQPLGFLCETNSGEILANNIHGVYKVDVHGNTKPGGFEYTVADYSSVYPFSMEMFRYIPHPYATTHYTIDGDIVVHYRRTDLERNSDYIFSKKAITNRLGQFVINEDSVRCFLSGGRPGNIVEKVYLYDNKGNFKVLDGDKSIFRTIASLTNTGRDIIPFADRDNNIWFYENASKNIMRVETREGSVDTFQLKWPYIPGHFDRSVFDRHGNLWVPSPGFGIYKIQPKLTRFHNLHTPFGLTKYPIRISTEGNSRLFDSELINAWVECIENQILPKEIIIEYGAPNHLVYQKIKSSLLHFGSGGYGKVSLNTLENKQFTYSILTDGGSTQKPYYNNLYFIDNDGKVWLTASEISDGHTEHKELLFRLDGNKIVEQYVFPDHPPVSNTGIFASDVYEQANNKLWFATTYGVYAFAPETGDWEHRNNIPGDTTSLSGDVTLCITPDPHEPEKYYWIGTDGGGLNKMDVRTGKCRRFTVDDGLPNNVIYNMLTDAHNNFWLSTNNGLCLFNTKTYKTRNFSIKDGLGGNEFNRYAASKDNYGRMYFSYVGGVQYFNPEDFYNDTLLSATVINELKLFNQKVDYRHNPTGKKNEYSLPAAVEYCDELIFRHDEGMITLGYSLLDLSNPGGNVYKYKLEGFNEDWIYAGTQREATFTNLSPGTYTFKVIGRNSNNVWSNEPASIRLVILPPWWGTWWFRILAAGIIAGGVYIFYRYRIRQLMKFENMRNSIALDLHDEIGSSLSSISLYATVVLRTAQTLPEKTTLLLDKIAKGTTEIMEGMNDIVWATKADNDTLEQVIERTRAFAANTTEAKGINLEFKVHKDGDNVKIDMQQRKNIYMFFKEAVNNAIKHSGCSNILVTIRYSKNKFLLSVQDDGKGFDKNNIMSENVATGGNGLQSMELRARQIKADFLLESTGKGTIISLSLPLK
jgi:ligand-binding sensor domain-containing protein